MQTSPENCRRNFRKSFVLSAGFLIVAAAVFFAVILHLNSGHLTFTLDDAYIHLALAENIMQGHYGINLNEYSAPASSILWPFLIAPFAKFSIASYIILVANTLFAIVTLLLFWKILSPETNNATATDTDQQTILSVMLILLIPACNLLGLVFTGMEHSLQVMLAVAIIYGLSKETKTSHLEWWTLGAIFLAPLVRYECLAISLPASIYLFLSGHRKKAILITLALIFVLTGFSWFLVSLGQNPLPNSVAAKSQIVYDQKTSSIILNFVTGIESSRGVLLAVCLLFMAWRAMNRRENVNIRLFCVTLSASIVLHLLFGKFGWFSRYEIYIWAASLAATGFLLKPFIYNNSGDVKPPEKALFLFAAMFLLCLPYLMLLANIPTAANNIYEQHYQMHRFVTEFYQKPVAANDIGYISYRNPEYILDLWGLASDEALKLRQQTGHKDWLETLVSSKDVGLAMIYDGWFDNIPASWQKLGTLELGKTRISPAHDKVAFYSLKSDATPATYNLLNKFSQTLPEGVKFEFASGTENLYKPFLDMR